MAKKEPPKQEGAVVTVEGERERTIALLSQHFAQDNLSLDELEKRIESAYKATTVPALRALTKDLVTESAAPIAATGKAGVPAPLEEAPEREKITAIMSSTKRSGVWRPARRVDVLAIMTDAELDLTQAVLPPGVTEIRIRGLMSAAKIIVPPGVRVVIQPSSIMSSVSDETLDPPAVGSGAPVIRLTGTLIMSDLRAVVRRREQLESGEE